MPKRKKRKFTDPFLQLDQEDSDGSSSSEDESQKRLTLAKNYISKIKSSALSQQDLSSDDSQLAQEVHVRHQKAEGIDITPLADTLSNAAQNGQLPMAQLSKHQQSITSLVLSSDGMIVYSGSKDGSIAKWCCKENRRVALQRGVRKKSPRKGHRKAILALDLSHNDKLLVSGGLESLIFVWSARDLTSLQILKGHRDWVTSLSFAKDSLKLYSGSKDRTVKSWNLNSFSFVETLFGHEMSVNAVDCVEEGRVLSCSSDRTARVFKVEEGVQLLFKAFQTHSAGLDCCAFLGRKEFVVGSQDGSLSLWTQSIKQPICVHRKAHDGKWINCVTSILNSDCFASGSSNDFIKIWKWTKTTENEVTKGTISQITQIALKGFINDLKFHFKGGKQKLLAAVGKDHRLGRWEVIKEAENFIREISLE